MQKDDIQKLMKELIEKILYHNNLYYVLAQPIISDGEYDELYKQLLDLENTYPDLVLEHSPTKKIGGLIQEGFKKADHPIPLISLANSYEEADLLQWAKQLQKVLKKTAIAGNKENIDTLENESLNIATFEKDQDDDIDIDIEYLVEPKLDGSSVEIVYKKGNFSQAITRGDGKMGEDITDNVKYVQNLPLYIEKFSHISEIRLRGEIVMPKSSFERLNAFQAENDDMLFANPRNAAAGTLRQLNSSVVKSRGLIIFVYDVLLINSTKHTHETFITDDQQLKWLETCGIPVYPWMKVVSSIDAVCKITQNKEIEKKLERSNTEMDGLVIKVNNLKLRNILGETEHHPRRAIAYKFPTKQVSAKLIDITYQVGRTGAITPVAELAPVMLGGVKVSRATLHNFDYIFDRDIRIGDWVWIQRSGEVIPYIIGPITAKRIGNEQKVAPPDSCPSCTDTLISNDGEVALLCVNRSCPAKQVQQIQHFVSKNCLDIGGLGEGVVQILFDAGLLNNWKDLFTLSKKSTLLRSLHGIGNKKIVAILHGIEKTTTTPLRRWIHGFGIPHVGKKTSQDLAKKRIERSSLEKNQDNTFSLTDYFLDSDFLETIYGLGGQIITALGDRAIREKESGLDVFLKLHSITFDVKTKSIPGIEKKLTGKKIVITGQFAGWNREQLIELIEQHGGIISSSVSSKTDYVLYGEKAGSKKKKASDLGIALLSLADLFNKIDYDTSKVALHSKKTSELSSVPMQGLLF